MVNEGRKYSMVVFGFKERNRWICLELGMPLRKPVRIARVDAIQSLLPYWP